MSPKVTAIALSLAILGTVALAQAAQVVCAVLYQDVNFGGPQFTNENQTGFSNVGWFNDKASSLKIYSGCTCTAFSNANFGGLSLVLDGDIADLGPSNPLFGWGDQFSSIVCSGPAR
jgi:hypothetical protein